MLARRPIGQLFYARSRLPAPRAGPIFTRVSDSEDDSTPKTAFNSADPPRNFTLSINERIRALTIGAPAYATRKKHIEDLEERYLRTLVALHDAQLAKRGGARSDDEEMTRILIERAATFDLKKMNALIVTHNRFYAIEANLPVDPRTGEYLVYGRRWMPEEPWTPARFVERARQVIEDRSAREER